MSQTAANQESFICRVRHALGHAPASDGDRRKKLFERPMDSQTRTLLETVCERTRQDHLNLLDAFCQRAAPLNLAVTPVVDSEAAATHIADLVAATPPEWGTQPSVVRWPDPLLDALDLEGRLADRSIPVHAPRLHADAPVDEQREAIRRQIIDAHIGITTADFCLADTATLVMKSRPHQARAVSLVPSMHIAVVRLEQLLADLKELYALLQWDEREKAEGLTHHLVMISGPSKTADIELVMVHGAHGPRAMQVVVITGA